MPTTLKDLLPILAGLSAERGNRVSLVELANESGCSSSHFQRAFSHIVGESPKQFTRRLGLECAAVLLISTDTPVIEVALSVGFESHEGFTRAFSAHFDQSPREFRKNNTETGQRHAGLLRQMGPCLGLFRATLGHNNNHQKDHNMNYDITTKAVEETTFLYKTARCTHGDMADTIGPLFGAVHRYAMQNGIEFVGPPTTIYVEYGPGMLTLHAGMPVQSGSKGNGEIELEILPASDAAMTIHTGPYDNLSDAHAAIEQYLDTKGLKVTAPLREVYLTDPGEVPNPEEWMTQLIWPCI